jgi:hypothetical protein
LTTENKDFKVKHGLVVAEGGTFGNSVAIGEPTAPSHAATKSYIDDIVADFYSYNIRPVIVATTENVNLSTGLLVGSVVDTVTLSANARVLVKNQTIPSENGIYVVNATGPATRSTDYGTSFYINPGDLIYVVFGTINSNTLWVLSTNEQVIVGTTSIEFKSISVKPGFGLSQNGPEISLDGGDVALVSLVEGELTLDGLIVSSNLQKLGTLDSLTVDGETTLTSLSVDNATASGTVEVLGELQVDGTAIFSGSATFGQSITVQAPTQAQNPATKAYVDSLLDQEQVEITTIDDLSNYFNGFENRFYPTYQGIPITLQNPFNLLLSIDGIIQSVGYPDYVWQSVMPRVGFRIDNDGYIVFPEPIPPGSGFDARVLVGSSTTKQTKIYPFKAMDIVLGGY